MNIRPAVLAILILTFLGGCQNPYSQFYTSVVAPEDVAQFRPYSGTTSFFSVSEADIKVAYDRLGSQGYNMMGYAAFEAGSGDYDSQLRSKAKELGADVVLVSSEFARTMTGIAPMLNYQPGQNSTTYSSGQISANAFSSDGTSSNGTANYSGITTTTSPGTFSTTYVPYSIQRNRYTASFWRKWNYIFGARYRGLSVSERQSLQRNSGLVVDVVVDNTPAFAANILVGDVLLKIDDEQVSTVDAFRAQLNQRAGHAVKIELMRNGKQLVVEVVLLPKANG